MDITSGSAGENLRICFGCMRPLSGDERICPVCGYDMEATQPAMFLKPGTYLARRYLVGKALSYDKYFITYLALDMVSNQRVEVKEYFPSEFAARLSEGRVNVYAGAAGEAFLAGLRKFWEEESSPQRSNLDGVVKVLDLFQANQTAYAVLERIEGKTLHEHLETNRMLPVSEATNILKQVLASLGFIHKAGLTYREFLPENILISEGGEVKLRDFGTVPMQFWVSPTEDPLWNVGCAPPEYMRADFKWNVQSDIYVLGTLFYEMITGHPPLDGQTRQRGGVLQLPSKLGIEIEPYVEDILQKSLSISPDERYKGVEEFLAAFEKQSKKPGKKSLQDEKKSVEKKAGNKKWFLIFVPAIALVLGICLYLGLSSGKKEEAQLELGRQYLASGDYEAARSAYTKALRINPDSEEAMQGLSQSLIASGNQEDVKEDSTIEQDESKQDVYSEEPKETDSILEEVTEGTTIGPEEYTTVAQEVQESQTAKKTKKKKGKESSSKKTEEDVYKVDDIRIERATGSYILPDSDQKNYSVEELSKLSSEVLAYALCEIYARRGLIFDSGKVTSWFENFTWYHARTEKEEDVSKYFTDEEKENINLMKQLLKEQGADFGKDIEEVTVSDVLTMVLDTILKDSGGESDSISIVYKALLDYMESSGSLEEDTSSTESTGTSLEVGNIKEATTTTQTYTPSNVSSNSSSNYVDDGSSYTDSYVQTYDEPVYQPQYQQDTYTPSYDNSYNDYDSGIGFGYSDYGDDHGGSDDYEYSISGDGAFGDGGYNVTVE